MVEAGSLVSEKFHVLLKEMELLEVAMWSLSQPVEEIPNLPM